MAFRVGIGALLLAALIAAFSLQQQPKPLRGDLAPDAFDAATGARVVRQFASSFADRRAGSPGDAAAATRVANELRAAMPTADVQTDEFRGDTPDGSRTLRNVTATLLGQPGPEIVVVAHRDALEPGSRAELSGTAGLVALARAAGQSRFQHTIRFVSTTAAAGGGLNGATRLARRLPSSVAAVIVLGDLSGSRDRPPEVVPWSNATTAGPLRLQRTVEAALSTEGLRPAGTDSLWSQIVHRGLPATIGEQGELNQGGEPAVLLGAGGTSGPPARAAFDPTRFAAYGRAALRSLRAVDDVNASVGSRQTGVVIVGQVMPSWALRVLILAVLLPVLVAGLAVGLTLARDDHPLLAGAAWTAGCAAGPLVAGLIAIGLGRAGLASPAVPAPYGGQAVHTGTGGWALVVVLTAVMIATVVVARPMLTRDATGRSDPTRTTVATGVFGLLALVTLALLVVSPVSAILVLPALLAWPAAIAPVPAIEPLHRVGLTILGAALPVAAVVTIVVDLGVPVAQIPWWLVLLIAGGHVTPFGLLLISLVAGTFVATALTLVPPGIHRWYRRFRAQRRAARERRRARHASEAPSPTDDEAPTGPPSGSAVPE